MIAMFRHVGLVFCVRVWSVARERLLIRLLSKDFSVFLRMTGGSEASHNVLEGSYLLEVPRRGG